jgi:photosystem II stability/assembly factor-like uncharacterized protein
MACTTGTTCVGVAAYVAQRTVAVFRTDDAGASWTEHHIAGATNLLSAVSCPDAQQCWVVTDGGVMHSTDGGTTWSEVDPGAQSLYGTSWSSVSCVSSATCYVGGAGISVTQDRGKSWRPVKLPPEVHTVQSVACERSGSCVALATRTNDPTIASASSVVLTNAPRS